MECCACGTSRTHIEHNKAVGRRTRSLFSFSVSLSFPVDKIYARQFGAYELNTVYFFVCVAVCFVLARRPKQTHMCRILGICEPEWHVQMQTLSVTNAWHLEAAAGRRYVQVRAGERFVHCSKRNFLFIFF